MPISIAPVLLPFSGASSVSSDGAHGDAAFGRATADVTSGFGAMATPQMVMDPNAATHHPFNTNHVTPYAAYPYQVQPAYDPSTGEA